MDHEHLMRNQAVRLIYSVVFFLVFAAIAVALDLLSQWITTLGVTDFTYYLVSWTAHFMLILDVLLFCISLLVEAWEFLRGPAK
jgi:hypothetical protein